MSPALADCTGARDAIRDTMYMTRTTDHEDGTPRTGTRPYLLIVACSASKRLNHGQMPALERYDGGTYRVLRKAQREHRWPPGLHILIVSARYGLITATAPIEDYDQRMTAQRAYEIRPQVLAGIAGHIRCYQPREVYIDLGVDYLCSVAGLEHVLDGADVTYAQGRIGERLRQLRLWLDNRALDSEQNID